MISEVKYPIGQQDFKSLRELGFVYIDKTMFIEKLLKGSQYYFLARPRRFGKSLFLSTLRYFFEGERALFKGLYVDTIGWNWEPYPVLHLDLNTDRYAQPGILNGVLEAMFCEWEKCYKVVPGNLSYSQRFRKIIQAAHEMTGKQVVILVDEYDKPLVGNLNNDDSFEDYRLQLASLYSNFKSSAEHIRLVLLTGVSRFSKLSVFSDLNNLKDITFSDEFADICGITEKELFDNFCVGIRKLADNEWITYAEACDMLKKNYDGYRFALRGSEIYNPWSVLNAMDESRIGNYWNETGKPAIVAETLKRVNADLEKVINSYCSLSDLQGLDLLDPNPTALLYQTGYITIKNYDRRFRQFHLGIPNREVKEGFFNELLPYYQKSKLHHPKEVINYMVRSFIFGHPDEAMKAMQTYFAGIDYSLRIENENNFHNAFYLLMDLVGLDTTAESHTSDGRIDIEIRTDDYIYIIELKYDRSAREALEQIDDKHYAGKYQTDSRKLFKIGVAFSSKSRCIENWEIRTN